MHAGVPCSIGHVAGGSAAHAQSCSGVTLQQDVLSPFDWLCLCYTPNICQPVAAPPRPHTHMVLMRSWTFSCCHRYLSHRHADFNATQTKATHGNCSQAASPT